jgi:hypothetical protein
MSTTGAPTATPRRRHSSGEVAIRPPFAPRPHTARVPAPISTPQVRGATTLFQIPFASAMSDADIALLARTLDLATHMHPKLHNSPTSQGVARLDFDSGLFLKRGPAEQRWVLEGRTWGHPSTGIVHDWHLLAAAAAHRLDPNVIFPERLAATPPETPTRPLGRAANKRIARIGRHILGLQ